MNPAEETPITLPTAEHESPKPVHPLDAAAAHEARARVVHSPRPDEMCVLCTSGEHIRLPLAATDPSHPLDAAGVAHDKREVEELARERYRLSQELTEARRMHGGEALRTMRWRARVHEILELHGPLSAPDSDCATCGVPCPCPTVVAAFREHPEFEPELPPAIPQRTLYDADNDATHAWPNLACAHPCCRDKRIAYLEVAASHLFDEQFFQVDWAYGLMLGIPRNLAGDEHADAVDAALEVAEGYVRAALQSMHESRPAREGAS